MKWFKQILCWHTWRRHDDLVEQYGFGEFYAFHQCQKCLKVKFRPNDTGKEKVKFIIPDWHKK